MTIFATVYKHAFSHVDDAPLIAHSPLVPAINQVFNVGADTPYTILQLAEEIAGEAFNKPLKVKHLDPRNEVVHAFFRSH